MKNCTNLDVNETGSNEKSSAVNLTLRSLATSPLNQFTIGHLENRWLAKPILNTVFENSPTYLLVVLNLPLTLCSL